MNPPFPRLEIDEAASEIVAKDTIIPNDPADEQKVGVDTRHELAEALNTVFSAGSGPPQPARFRLTIHRSTGHTVYGVFPCLILLMYVGCPMGAAEAEIELELETATERYVSRARESVLIGLYYNNSGPPWVGKYGQAIAPALQKALLEIRQQALNRPM